MDPELTLLFVVLFGLAGICCTVLALIAWLRDRRLPRTLGRLALLSTAVVMIILGTTKPEDGVLRRVSEPATSRRARETERPRQPPEYAVPGQVSEFGPTRWIPASGPPPPTPEQTAVQARVDEMHREFAPVLEQYRTEHGTYPPTLTAVGIATPMTQYGPLYYYSSGSKREPWYLLSFGDIETDRFSMDWDSRTGKWVLVQRGF